MDLMVLEVILLVLGVVLVVMEVLTSSGRQDEELQGADLNKGPLGL